MIDKDVASRSGLTFGSPDPEVRLRDSSTGVRSLVPVQGVDRLQFRSVGAYLAQFSLP